MDNQYPLNPIQRNTFSREGIRLPSRDKSSATPEIRKSTTLTASQQNFYKTATKDFLNESTSSAEDLMLASLNIAIDETGFISTLKADILQLQEEINRMDLDGKIRNTSPSDIMKKNHIYAMLKFLGKHSNQNVKKQIEQKLAHAATFDTADLIKFMGVKNEEEGIRKLFRIIGTPSTNSITYQLTEYNIIGFLKYDQIFETLRKQFGSQPMTKTAGMDSGIAISRFQTVLANLEREFELFSYIGKLMQKNPNQKPEEKASSTSVLGSINSIEELYENLKKGINLGLKGEVSIELLNLIESTMKSKQGQSDIQKQLQRMELQLKEKTSSLQKLEKELTERDRFYKEQEAAFIKKIRDLEKLLDSKEEQLEAELHRQREELTKAQKSDSGTREKEYLNQISTMEKSIKDFKIEVQQLRETEIKLTQQIKTLKEENQNLQKSVEAKSTTQAVSQGSDYYIGLIQQTEESYKEKIEKLEEANKKLSNEVVDLDAKISALESEKEELLRKIRDYKEQHELDLKLRGKGDDTFEGALREQFDNMKKAFEEKIRQLNESMQQLKKDKGREIVELKNQLSRERENRELLLRKLQLYTKT